MIATPASARASAVRPKSASSSSPRQKAWLTASLPSRPSARPRARSRATRMRPARRRRGGGCPIRRHALRRCENRVKMTVDIVIDAGRVQTADEISARRNRRVKQIRRAGVAHHARLRKGDSLNVDEMAVALLQRKHRLQALQADLRSRCRRGCEEPAFRRRRPARSAFRRAPGSARTIDGGSVSQLRSAPRSCRRECAERTAGQSGSCRDACGRR